MKNFFIWLINIGLKILVFKSRNNNIWLFGEWGGDSYKDNSRYLFEYINKYYPTIDAVWITKNVLIKEKLQKKNMKVFISNEKIAINLRLNAGFVFFTNGINDIGMFDLAQGSTKIALWHGMPLKKLLYASNKLQMKEDSFMRYLQYLYLKVYNSSQRNLSIATSQRTKDFLVKSFEVVPESVLITGQPRNDILSNSQVVEKVKNKFNHLSNEKFILYMPTWRNFNSEDTFLDTIIENFYMDRLFLKKLKDNNIKLYIKHHPRVVIKSKSKDNIIIIDNKSSISPQEIIASADVLITDYSSVFIDYALLDRPIYFYVPDLDEYITNGNDIFIPFSEFSDFLIEDINKLKKVIFELDIFKFQGLKNTIKINKIFNDNRLKKYNFSKKLIDTLIDKKIWINKDSI